MSVFGSTLENQADELPNYVLDYLKADDFRILREFRGKPRLTTHLTTIIANQVIDLIRGKKAEIEQKSGPMGWLMSPSAFVRRSTVAATPPTKLIVS